jgi:hypothetical protein
MNTEVPSSRGKLYSFQVYDLFNKEDVEAFIDQSKWETLYPDFMKAWRSPDVLTSERSLFPEEILLAIARNCLCIGDFFADPDGQTLHIVGHGKRPFRFYKNESGKTIVEEIAGATKISTEQAIIDYGPDAVWIAQEYGRSRRGEIEDKYRNMIERIK